MVTPDEPASYRPATQLLHSKFPALQRTSDTCGGLAASAQHAGSCSSRAVGVRSLENRSARVRIPGRGSLERCRSWTRLDPRRQEDN